MRQVLADYNIELMKWGDFLGSRDLRIEIAKHLYHTRSMMVSPDCIVIGSGIEYLYSRLIRILPAGSIYAVENPGYRKIPHIYEENGVHWTWVAMGEGGIHMSSLRESRANVVHTSPEHHYPLGTVMTARRRQELLKWLEEKEERYLIEDDYDCEFRYHGRPISALYSLDQSHHVIYMNTFSKTLSPAIRISYMILPEHLLKKYVDTAGFFSNTSSNLEQYTLARFFKDGCFTRHLNRLRKFCHLQGKQLAETIKNTPAIPCIQIRGIESGTHLLIKLDTGLTDSKIKKRAEEKGIRLCCLSKFCIDDLPQYQHTLVLNYTSMNAEQMQQVIQILGEIF